MHPQQLFSTLIPMENQELALRILRSENDDRCRIYKWWMIKRKHVSESLLIKKVTTRYDYRGHTLIECTRNDLLTLSYMWKSQDWPWESYDLKITDVRFASCDSQKETCFWITSHQRANYNAWLSMLHSGEMHLQRPSSHIMSLAKSRTGHDNSKIQK